MSLIDVSTPITSDRNRAYDLTTARPSRTTTMAGILEPGNPCVLPIKSSPPGTVCATKSSLLKVGAPSYARPKKRLSGFDPVDCFPRVITLTPKHCHRMTLVNAFPDLGYDANRAFCIFCWPTSA